MCKKCGVGWQSIAAIIFSALITGGLVGFLIGDEAAQKPHDCHVVGLTADMDCMVTLAMLKQAGVISGDQARAGLDVCKVRSDHAETACLFAKALGH